MRRFLQQATILAGMGSVVCVSVAVGQIPQFQLPSTEHEKIDVTVEQAPTHTQPLIVQLILDSIPHDFTDEREWGKTKKVWKGVHLRLDGLKVRTHRKWKNVNQGTWKRYTAKLIDPTENLRLHISDLVETEPGRVEFALSTKAKLNLSGRVQEWQRGIRLYSISAEAIADIQLDLRCSMKSTLVLKELPPKIQINPSVETAKVRLTQFKLQRVSSADGPIIREIGDGLEKILRKELAKKNEKIAVKMNQQIRKNEDKLTLSIGDAVKSKIFKPASLASPSDVPKSDS